MVYAKGILSGLAAWFLAIVAADWSFFRIISREKATGLGAMAGVLTSSLFSPVFWIFAALFFALFFFASRLGNKFLRVFFFWIPTLAVSTFGLAIVALFAFVYIHFRNQ